MQIQQEGLDMEVTKFTIVFVENIALKTCVLTNLITYSLFHTDFQLPLSDFLTVCSQFEELALITLIGKKLKLIIHIFILS